MVSLVFALNAAGVVGLGRAVLGACMFGGGILVSPLMALGGEGSAVAMVAVVATSAVAALAAAVGLTRRDPRNPPSTYERRRARHEWCDAPAGYRLTANRAVQARDRRRWR